MKIRSLAYLFVVFSLAFAACTKGNDTTEVDPNNQPEQQPEEQPEEQPKEDIIVDAADFVGEYYGDAFTQKSASYTLILTDNGFLQGGGMMPNSTYYMLDVYGDFYEGERGGYVNMPEGTYTMDATNSMEMGTICKEYSYFMTTDETQISKQVKFESAEIVITSNKATLTAVVEGVKHIVTFNGQATITDKRGVDREFDANNAWVYFYGDHDSKGVADNYYLYFSDIDTEYGLLPKATYYRLDLFSEIVDKSNGTLAIPYGTYIVDESSSRTPYTVTVEYSDFVKLDKYGDAAEYGKVMGGQVVVDENGITAELHIMGGVHKINYSGYIPVSNYSGSFFE